MRLRTILIWSSLTLSLRPSARTNSYIGLLNTSDFANTKVTFPFLSKTESPMFKSSIVLLPNGVSICVSKLNAFAAPRNSKLAVSSLA